jgi:hypothetical protein
VNTVAAQEPIAIRLHQALQGDALPPEGRAIGQRLLTRLNQPTRIAVIGLAGSGKTALVNMLLGARLMPDLGILSAIELSHADAARADLVRADGSIRALNGLPDAAHLPPDAVRLMLGLPDPRLAEWSFLEVGLSPSAPDASALLDWTAKRSDIAIWCSQLFDDRERSLWSQVPDHLKDHSFLVLTRADRLLMKGELTERIARLQPVVADEFLGLYPVATLQAAAARDAGGAPQDALWQSSGAKAFVGAIRQQVDQARTASLDHAYVLLERYKVAEPAPKPAAPTTPPPAAARPAPAAPQADAKAVIRKALGVLQGCADDLIAAPDAAAGPVADRVLDCCAATADALVQLLSQTDASDPALEALKDDAVAGEEMLMLLRLERGETAAEDSLTVLVQLKKELSERLAP